MQDLRKICLKGRKWYIGVAKRRGWDEVVRLLKQYPKDEERMKMLIKKRLANDRSV